MNYDEFCICSLVEEFMLLANMLVARQLYEKFPNAALLRSHSAPSQRVLSHICNVLKNFGIILDTFSAGSLNRSLMSLEPDPSFHSRELYLEAKYRFMVINNLCAKSMMVNNQYIFYKYEFLDYAFSDVFVVIFIFFLQVLRALMTNIFF